MDKQIHINRTDLHREPEVRRYLTNNAEDTDLHIVAKRSPKLIEADESDTIVFEGRRYKIRWKNVIGSEAEGAVEFGLLDIGQIKLG